MLIPNNTYTVNGVEVREKIVPDGLRWKDVSKAEKAGFSANALYKKNMKLNGGTGKPLSITVHNTNDLAGVEDDGEQYTRATYNENMDSARVHFFVDDVCAWQNLKAGTGQVSNDPPGSAEVSWHSGDGSVADGGNMTSISIEIIMGDTAAHDAKARDNGARLAAWLLWKHELTIDNLLTHTYWVNKSVGQVFAHTDEQCTNPVRGKKWCPSYIFGSTNRTVALKNWRSFKTLVSGYLDELNGNVREIPETTPSSLQQYVVTPDFDAAVKVKAGELVKLSGDAVYYSGKSIPKWVKSQNWYVKNVSGDRAVIDKNEKGDNSINSPINTRYLTAVDLKKNNADDFSPYLVKVTASSLNIRNGAGTDFEIVGAINDRGVYTVVAESVGKGAFKWGKLKSGAGWISLDHTKML